VTVQADVPSDTSAGLPEDAGQLSARLRNTALENFPPGRIMPDRQPAYVASWIYVFGVLTMSALSIVILTGIVLAIFGPSWWHVSSTGLFVNSLHLWSVEAFFFFMVIHLWGKFFMAAWRGKRRATWITGVVSFVVSVGAAFTGYLSQQNFDSQWIGTQAKDGINSTGAGAVFNVLNFGQMLMWHIVLLPLAIVAIVGVHVLLVRRRGVVPPFAAPAVVDTAAEASAAGTTATAAGTTATANEGVADSPGTPDTGATPEAETGAEPTTTPDTVTTGSAPDAAPPTAGGQR
jgi:ubiquinol-cytochrome c reductase cytochrome b subunit